jgi:predicted ribosome quality control (RQC) complex YloA/Tae2 family protein
MPRLHLAMKKPPAMTSPHPMVIYLRSHLPGATVRGVAVVNSDRVVEILLSGKGSEYRIMVELTGSATNLVLLDAAGIIKAVYYPVPASDDRKRQLLAGLTYVAPPAREPRFEATTHQQENASAISAVRLPHPSPSVTDTPANQAAEAYFKERISGGQLDLQRKELLRALTKCLLRVGRRSEALCADLALSSRAEE